ncbi:MAG TPA: glycosyltransferase family A protein [Chlamydiales bacterium]|jgi:glycosyltransferase involved in cell wall biosynthesis|nr:glycosyltransferase family A protein [Chlamydiales bacterium]
MLKVLGGLFLFGAVFGGAFYWGKERCSMGLEEGEARFQRTLYPVTNRSFAVVIIGRNNGAFVEKTLQSVFSQNYLDFRIFYVDDGSNDGSFELASDLIYESGQLMRVTMIRNEEPLGTLASLRQVVDTCPDSEILVVMGGQDWLAHEWVLSTLNQYYSDPDLWLTFGQYREYPEYSLGFCRPLRDDRDLRHQPLIASHLKTFYAGLFRQIQPQDLIFETDLAYMLPMLEMARGHSTFIPEILYIENRAVLHKEDREAISASEKEIRGLKAYEPLERIPL